MAQSEIIGRRKSSSSRLLLLYFPYAFVCSLWVLVYSTSPLNRLFIPTILSLFKFIFFKFKNLPQPLYYFLFEYKRNEKKVKWFYFLSGWNFNKKRKYGVSYLCNKILIEIDSSFASFANAKKQNKKSWTEIYTLIINFQLKSFITMYPNLYT